MRVSSIFCASSPPQVHQVPTVNTGLSSGVYSSVGCHHEKVRRCLLHKNTFTHKWQLTVNSRVMFPPWHFWNRQKVCGRPVGWGLFICFHTWICRNIIANICHWDKLHIWLTVTFYFLCSTHNGVCDEISYFTIQALHPFPFPPEGAYADSSSMTYHSPPKHSADHGVSMEYL